MTSRMYGRRARNVACVKALLAGIFLVVVVFTLPSPVSLIVSLIDLAFVPVFVLLARQSPRVAAYALVLETAAALTPRQFVQGYVNAVNWPIYILIPLIAVYMLRTPRAGLWSALITAAVALPVMTLAALTLPPGMRPADVFTAIVFVTGLMMGAAVVVSDMAVSPITPLDAPRPITLCILDGAMGTELARRGIDTGLPLWSANALLKAPDVVRQIHVDYIAAGARIITTDTFRTNVRTLRRAGLLDSKGTNREQGQRMHELVETAVALAHQAVTSSGVPGVRIAGSMAPVEDCYSPVLVPTDESVLYEEHVQLARELAMAGCDLLLIETMNTVREAAAAARAASETGLPVWVSLMLDAHQHLLSGESIADAVRAVLPYKPQALLVNCLPVAQVSDALIVLRQAVGARSDIAIGAYANAGHVEGAGWSMEHGVTPSEYAAAALRWQALGATIIGGCCGTTPEYISALLKEPKFSVSNASAPHNNKN